MFGCLRARLRVIACLCAWLLDLCNCMFSKVFVCFVCVLYCLFVCLFECLFVCLFVSLFVRLFGCWFACLNVCVCVRWQVCLIVC